MTESARREALELLAEVDRELWQQAAPLRTLAPDGGRARGLAQVVDGLLSDGDSTALVAAVAAGLARFARTQLAVFADNLFWDFDYPVAAWLAEARAAANPAAHLERSLSLATALLRQYGPVAGLGFRYAHDFTYGFDWAKWVGRDPVARRGVGPFDWVFLQAMAQRGHELTEAIARGDDCKYPPLPEGMARNPFEFSREPARELVVHQAMARRGWIPVQAWRGDAAPRWDEPFQDRRKALAQSEE